MEFASEEEGEGLRGIASSLSAYALPLRCPVPNRVRYRIGFYTVCICYAMCGTGVASTSWIFAMRCAVLKGYLSGTRSRGRE
eukprot:3254367-Rhodomonas_salina.4